MARRATSLGPKPSVFVLFVVFFCWGFFSLFLIEKPCFSPWKGHFFVYFQCFPFFLPSLFWPPPFSLSLALSLSFSFFLPSFLSFFFAFFLFLVFVSFFLFLSSSLLFHEKNNIKLFNYKAFVHQSFLICIVFLSYFSLKSPFLIFVFFLFFSFVFVQHQCSYF